MWPQFDAQKKRERRTAAAPSTPAKGRMKQHMADAPFRGRGPSTDFMLKSLAAQVGGFEGSSAWRSRAIQIERGGDLPASGMSKTCLLQEHKRLRPSRPEPTRLYPSAPPKSIPCSGTRPVQSVYGGKTDAPVRRKLVVAISDT